MRNSTHLLVIILFFSIKLFGQSFSYLDNYSSINDVAIGADGCWVVTPGGLLLYDLENGTLCDIFNRSNSPLNGNIMIKLDRAGVLYVSNEVESDKIFLYKFYNNDWNLIQTDLQSDAEHIAFDEINHIVYCQSEIQYNPCGNVEIGDRSTFHGPDGGAYTKFYKRVCGGGSQSCGCSGSLSKIKKSFNGQLEEVYDFNQSGFGFDQNLIVDTSGNFWTLENNKFTTLYYDGQVDGTVRDSIESDTAFHLYSINSENKFRLYKEGGGFYLYDGTQFEQLTTAFPFEQFGATWGDEDEIVVSHDNELYHYADDQWVLMEGPFKFPSLIRTTSNTYYYNTTSVINNKGSHTWMMYGFYDKYQYLQITETDYFHFHPENSPVLRHEPDIINADLENQIWLYYEATDTTVSLLLNHNGDNWMSVNANDLGITTLKIDEIQVDPLGGIWFLNEEDGTYLHYDEDSNWNNYNNQDTYNNHFSSIIKWEFLEDNVIQKTFNGQTTLYPPILDGDSISGPVINSFINDSGNAWVFIQKYPGTNVYREAYHFDGNEWIFINTIYIQPEYYKFDYYHDGDHLIIFYSNNYSSGLLPKCTVIKGSEITLDMTFQSLSNYPSNYHKHNLTTTFLGLNENNEMILSYSRSTATGNSYSPIYYKSGYLKVVDGEFEEFSNPLPYYQNLQIDNDNQFWWGGLKGLATTKPLTNAPFQFSKQDDCDFYGGVFSLGNLQGGKGSYLYQWSDSNSNARRDNMTPGSYHCLMTDGAGNVDNFSFEIESENQIVTNLTIIEPTSLYAEDGQIEISVSEGTPPYSYLWSTGSTESILLNIPFDVVPYSVTVTDADGCEVNRTIPMNLTSTVEIEMLHNVSCPGGPGGVATVHAMKGIAIETIEWTNNQSIITVDNLDNIYVLSNVQPGNLKVTVTDIYGTVFIDKITLTAPDGIDQVVIETQTNGDNLTLTPEITGGIPPFEFQWSNGSNEAFLDEVPMGNYSVTVTDFNGCQKFDKHIMQNFTANDPVFERNIGTATNEVEGRFGVYPNPTANFLNIQISNELTSSWDFKLLDVDGKILLENSNINDSSFIIDLSIFPPGVYFLSIESEGAQYFEKVVRME